MFRYGLLLGSAIFGVCIAGVIIFGESAWIAFPILLVLSLVFGRAQS